MPTKLGPRFAERVSRQDVDVAVALTRRFQPLPDTCQELAIAGQRAIIIEDQVFEVQRSVAGNFDLKHHARAWRHAGAFPGAFCLPITPA